jgi:hypothetical protein
MLSPKLWMETVHWKTFIGNLWTVGESVGKKYTKRFTDRQSVLKTFTHFISLVYPSVNIKYYRKNTIFNVVGVLVVAVTFKVILFQPYPHIFLGFFCLIQKITQPIYMVQIKYQLVNEKNNIWNKKNILNSILPNYNVIFLNPHRNIIINSPIEISPWNKNI